MFSRFHQTFLFLLMLISLPVSAQDKIEIHGRVWKPKFESPIQGASVVETKGKRHVLTDSHGKFSVEVEPGDTLFVLALGYKRFTYPIGLQPKELAFLHIVLQSDTVNLGEVEIKPVILKPKKVVPKPDLGLPPGLIKASIVGSPITYFYNIFSKEAKERRKLQRIKLEEYLEYKRKEKEYYNSFFKDNTGYN